MFKLLIDTCVWLDTAKDASQIKIIEVIEKLVKRKEVSLIVPRVIIEEFEKHDKRIIHESSRSISSALKRVKEIANQLKDTPKRKKSLLNQLNDIDHKLPTIGDSLFDTVKRIDYLLKNSNIIEASDEIKLRAIQRAIDNKAPFHRGKNSINDSIIIESYADQLKSKNATNNRFAFVTHNTKDFSSTNGDFKLPHPDIALYFSKRKSLYFIKLSEALRRINPELISDFMLEQEGDLQSRSFTEIIEVENELTDKLWYNRHQFWLHKIKIGKHKIVDKNRDAEYDPNTTPREIFDGARKAAKEVEKKYGKENLGPYSDFEWGILNGKLSAIRWVIGIDWDNLDT